jgi:N-methylhydantoinase A
MRIAGQPVRVPAVSIETIGAGGGSIGWVDSVGALKVGPQSAGADPGPACYGKGGDQPTLTDAYAVLGYVDPEGMFAQSIRVHRELAERAIRPIAERYRYGIPAAAEALLEIANANMNRALRLVSVEKGYDLREFALIAFGGAGPIHAARLAQQLGIPRVVVPHLSGAFSAFGGLVSDVRHDYVRTYLASLGPDGTSPEPGGETRSGLDTAFGDLESLVASDLARVGYDSRAVRLARSVDLRYHGQNYEIEVPLPRRGAPAAALRARFHQIHRKLYSYALPDSTIECVNIRVAATVASARPSLPRLRSQPDGVAGEPGGKKPPTPPSTPASRTKRPAYFAETGPVDLPVFDRAALGPGVGIRGPAVVEEPWSTTLVYPGQTATVDAFGNLLIEVQT